MTDAKTIPVSEVFGNTIQGEGPYAGRAVCFVRTGGCNLSCSWCDSEYTWRADKYDLHKENPPTTVEEILDRLPGGQTPVIISGGEPLLHQRNEAFQELLTRIKRAGREVHIETNGTVAPSIDTFGLVDHYSVSPKLPNAGEHKRSQHPEPWDGWGKVHNSIFKYVVTDKADVLEAIRRAEELGIPRTRIWVMPEGTSTEALQARWPEIARVAADEGINATHRIHVLAFGDTKGT